MFFVAILFSSASLADAAAPIELEIATEQGVQITAPQEWLQLLTSIGIDHVRIRGARSGDTPLADNRGSDQRPAYHVVGILTQRGQLRLPGGTFTRSDRGRIKDYFEQLGADGPESVTVPRGQFGLTEKEMQAALADLAQPIDFETRGQPLRTLLNRLQSKLAAKFDVDAQASRVLRNAKPIPVDVKGVASGSGLAIVLRNQGLVFRPAKRRGQPVVYQITAGEVALDERTVGKTDDMEIKNWPIGWEPQEAPGVVVPILSQFLNANIDGYSLEEALTALAARVKIPFVFDHAVLAARQIDPAKIQVRLPRTRTVYKRVIDRILSQAGLGSELRVDEAGAPFLWITR
jgi:hypothetical protein